MRVKEFEYHIEQDEDDAINPSHYTAGEVECFDAIASALNHDELRGYLKGQVIKYTWREGHKNGDEDLKKAQWYIEHLIAMGDAE